MSKPMRGMDNLLTMKKKRVMCLGIFYQPLHSVQHIGLCWKPFRIPIIVRQDQNVLRLEIPVLCQVVREVNRGL